ncbi:hypothetical protein DV735_g318, partial [Chaetothyriales sp. CBS 134920]
MAINFRGNLYAWNDGREIALWTVGGVLLLLFGLQQAFKIGTTFEHRIFPADLLQMRIMWLLFALMSAAATCVFVPTFYIPILFQFVRGDSPLTAGVRLLPFICTMVFMGLLNGAFMSKVGYAMVLGRRHPHHHRRSSDVYHGGGNPSNAQVYGYSVLIGIGAGMFIQTGFAVAQAKVPKERAADAAGFIALAQNLGIVLALAISGAIFQNKAIENLQQVFPDLPSSALHDAISGAGSDLLKQLPPDAQTKVLGAILNAISYPYILVITAGAMATVGSLFMKFERIIVEGAGAM